MSMSSSVATDKRIDAEKPENGLKGLRYWKQDLLAGLIVSLVSVPLSLGIAVASGAPPIAGLISSIIAGMLFPFLGGAYMTISGPAAGLAPVIFASICALGHGNMQVGYPLVLAVICLAGALQLVLSYFRAARFSAMFPAAAIEGMLVSIGLLIIAKQIPYFLGHQYKSHEFFGIVAETPLGLLHLDPSVTLVSVVCLTILFGWSAIKNPQLKVIPPQLIVVVAGILLGQLLHLPQSQLIHIPANPLEHGIVFPNFHGLFSDPALVWTVVGCVLTLTLVDGFESLATIIAVDRIDPYRRKSQPNRTLFAMGLSNIFSSLAGGLTIIPGGIKSTTNILSGGMTLWANFYNACFLLIYLLLAREVINLIPVATLAAVLIHIGYKLAAPKKWFFIASIGREQFCVFIATIFFTLYIDLLWGLILGMLTKFAICWYFATTGVMLTDRVELSLGVLRRSLRKLVGNPIGWNKTTNGIHEIVFTSPVVCFNALHVANAFAAVPEDAQRLRLTFAPSVGLVDHTSASNIMHFAREFEAKHGTRVELRGLLDMRMSSGHDSCMRLARAHRVAH